MKNCLADQQNNCSRDQAAYTHRHTLTQRSCYRYSHIILSVLAGKTLHAPTPTCHTACYLHCLMRVLTHLLYVPA